MSDSPSVTPGQASDATRREFIKTSTAVVAGALAANLSIARSGARCRRR